MSVEAIETCEITERATAGGWTLPDEWRVMADMTRDDAISTPADEGEAYTTDFDVPDYSDPTKGFCRHCDRVIVRGKERWYEGTRVDCPDNDDASIVCDVCDGDGCIDDDGEIDCPTCRGEGEVPGHALAESKAVQWWRTDEWMFVCVSVWVEDHAGREWGRDGIGGTECGTFPQVADDGTVGWTRIEPLEDKPGEYSVVREHDMIGNALREAMQELAEHGTPEITMPPGETHAGL